MATSTPARKTNGGLALTNSLNEFFRPLNDWFNDPVLDRALTVPAVNITESDKAYKLSVAAPGLTKEDFNIDVTNNMLSVSAEQTENKEDKGEGYSRREYNYSSFSRSFTLPEEVKQDAIEAEYKDGVLQVTLPKNEASLKASKKVPIK